MNAMVDNLDAIQRQQERIVHLENEALELLLFNWLQEFIYYKDAEQLLLRIEQVDIVETDRSYTLQARVKGEPLDPQRHDLGTDVKAITLHRFALGQTAQGWQAFVVLDV